MHMKLFGWQKNAFKKAISLHAILQEPYAPTCERNVKYKLPYRAVHKLSDSF